MAARNVNLDYATLVGTVKDLREFLDMVDGDGAAANVSMVGAKVVVLREAPTSEQLAAAFSAMPPKRVG